jgi:hypothetical protein
MVMERTGTARIISRLKNIPVAKAGAEFAGAAVGRASTRYDNCIAVV